MKTQFKDGSVISACTLNSLVNGSYTVKSRTLSNKISKKIYITHKISKYHKIVVWLYLNQ